MLYYIEICYRMFGSCIFITCLESIKVSQAASDRTTIRAITSIYVSMETNQAKRLTEGVMTENSFYKTSLSDFCITLPPAPLQLICQLLELWCKMW